MTRYYPPDGHEETGTEKHWREEAEAKKAGSWVAMTDREMKGYQAYLTYHHPDWISPQDWLDMDKEKP